MRDREGEREGVTGVREPTRSELGQKKGGAPEDYT